MPSFPSIAPPSYPWDEIPEDVGMMSKNEDGTVKSRARFTRSRTTFILRWPSMSDHDHDDLMNFYRNTVKGSGLAFSWTCNNPNSEFYESILTVRFASPPRSTNHTVGRWSVEVTLIQE